MEIIGEAERRAHNQEQSPPFVHEGATILPMWNIMCGVAEPEDETVSDAAIMLVIYNEGSIGGSHTMALSDARALAESIIADCNRIEAAAAGKPN
jgi:hypothetical protein